MIQFLISVLQLEYSIIKLFFCWYNCCVQTSSLQSFFKWIKLWNQMFGVVCPRCEWIRNYYSNSKIILFPYLKCIGAWGSVVVKALRYYSDGLGIYSLWCHWGFFPWFQQNHAHWKWVPGISPGVNVAGAYGWRPTTPVVPNVEMIRGLNLPGTPRATSARRGTTLLYFTLL